MALTAELIGSGIPALPAAYLSDGRLNVALTFTNKAIAGASGNITQNVPAGRVQFAAAASTLTLTNSFITANSLIICTVGTNDATAFAAAAIPAAGSATIKLNAAATGVTVVNYVVIN